MSRVASLALAAVIVASPLMAYKSGEIIGLDASGATFASPRASPSPLAVLGATTEWLNTPPLTAQALRGKVVLVDFWTYSCINWRRQHPYVRAWAEKYKDHGLVVIGAHTPEFAFEKDVANIRRALKEMNVPYPVAIDSDYRIWNGFGNNYWPALYFIDAKGQVRHQHFGEGEYASSERMLQRLLAEAGANGFSRDLVMAEGRGPEAPPDLANLRTGETYVGYQRGENFSSAGGVARDKPRAYAIPARLGLNEWALAGTWTIGGERATSNQPNGRIAFRFHARDVHLVMGPRAAPVRFRVLLDGRPPGADRGSDIDADGYGSLHRPTMFQLIRQGGAVRERLFEIEFLDTGAEAYSFTFG